MKGMEREMLWDSEVQKNTLTMSIYMDTNGKRKTVPDSLLSLAALGFKESN